MKATITLNSEYDSHGKDLEDTAHHEILHLLLVPLVILIFDNREESILQAEHKIINHILKSSAE